MPWSVFNSHPGIYPFMAPPFPYNNQKTSPEITRRPLGGKSPLAEVSDSKVVKLEMLKILQDTFLVSFFIMEDNWMH